MDNITTTMSDDKKIKIKVVDLQKLDNFVVEIFSFELFFTTKSEFEFLKFEFFWSTSDGETTKMKFVDIKKLWNNVVDNFLIWNHLDNQNYV